MKGEKFRAPQARETFYYTVRSLDINCRFIISIL